MSSPLNVWNLKGSSLTRTKLSTAIFTLLANSFFVSFNVDVLLKVNETHVWLPWGYNEYQDLLFFRSLY